MSLIKKLRNSEQNWEALHRAAKRWDVETRVDELDQLLKDNPPTPFKGIIIARKKMWEEVLEATNE